MFKNVHHGACICPGDRHERSPGQGICWRWSTRDSGQCWLVADWRLLLAVRTGHVGTGIEALRFLYWAPQVRPQPSDGHRRTRAEHHSDPSRAVYSFELGPWTAAPNCPSCRARPMRSASPQLQILQGRAKLDMNAAAASPSPTPSRRCSIVMRCRAGRTDVRHTRKWSQIHACTAPDAVWGAVCALECVA